METKIVPNESLSRFELTVDGHTAFITFDRGPETMILVHTEVPTELEGQGVGTTLVRGALEYIRDNGLRLVPRCPFIRAYLKRHPDEAASFNLDPAAL